MACCQLPGCTKAATVITSHGELPGAMFCCHECSAAYCRGKKIKDGYPGECQLRVKWKTLMSDHVYRTLRFIELWNAGLPVAAAQEHLLKNQDDIGEAFGDVWGGEVRALVSRLFREHIALAVPVLVAAKSGKGVPETVAAWRKNASEIADALASLGRWERGSAERHLNSHLDQTIAYATAVIKRDEESIVSAFDVAHHHMLMFADYVSQGIGKELYSKKP